MNDRRDASVARRRVGGVDGPDRRAGPRDEVGPSAMPPARHFRQRELRGSHRFQLLSPSQLLVDFLNLTSL